jgi:hypothetical protein
MKHLILFPTRDAVTTFHTHLGVLWPEPIARLKIVRVMGQFLAIYHTRRRLSVYEQRQIPAIETVVKATFNLGLIDTPFMRRMMSNSYLTAVPERTTRKEK